MKGKHPEEQKNPFGNQSAGSGNTYTNGDGTALAALLARQGVRLTKVGTPVTSTDGDDAELGDDDGGADSSSDFLGGLDTETDVALGVTNDDDGLEAGALTGTGLLLDGLDLHDLVLELGQEVVDNLVLLDGQRVKVNLLHAVDLASLYETAKLGNGLPLLLVALAATTATATSSTAASATSETTATSAISHNVEFVVVEKEEGSKDVWLSIPREGGL